MLERFHWMIYVFGAFLVLTGIKISMMPPRRLLDRGVEAPRLRADGCIPSIHTPGR
jgi:hypothetical protein